MSSKAKGPFVRSDYKGPRGYPGTKTPGVYELRFKVSWLPQRMHTSINSEGSHSALNGQLTRLLTHVAD